MKESKHKLLFIIICALYILLLTPMIKPKVASAAATSDGFQYEVSGNEAAIVGYNGPGGNIIIPETINDGVNTYTVTDIRLQAFYYKSNIFSVVIPDSVTSIGDGAFLLCNNLTIVSIGNNVTSIGAVAFGYCKALTNIEIPNNVLSIGNSAFEGCSSLTSITIPDKVTSIGDGTFFSCSNLKSVTFGNSIKSIGSSAFYDCSSLIGINIPDSVTNIGDSAFNGCYKLMSAVIGNNVTSIGNLAFSGCSNLSSMTIPGSVTNIGNAAFTNCPHLTSLEVSEKNMIYSSIDGVLYNKSKTILICYPTAKLGSSFIIPDSVNCIKADAFYDCRNLNSVTIPDSVTDIGNGAFSNCSKLASITIPDGVTSIGEDTFSGCTNLMSIDIPKSVTNIGSSAFTACNSLMSVTIPDGVTSIGMDTFTYCHSLTNITIPDSVTSIGAAAFYGCTSLKYIEIPKNVTSIGDNAFDSCSNLTAARFIGNAPVMGENVFNNCNPYFKIYYLEGNIGFTNPWNWYSTEPFYIYTVTFDSMEGSPIDANTVYSSSQIAVPEMPVRAGFIFGGWYKEAGCINAWNFNADEVTDNTTLYAKWVAKPVTGISLDKTIANLKIGDSINLAVTINPTDAVNKNVTWTSSNASIARVDNTGKVTAVGIGTAIIKAASVDGGYAASCTVTVNTIAAPTSVKVASSSYNSINVSWSGITGASGYQVYRAASSTGTYVLTATTAGVSYNNIGLTTNSTYYYKVRAYNIAGSSKVYSSFSSVVSAKPIPAAPASVKAVSSSYNSVNVSWSGVTGANGYQIYRGSSSTGTYSLILTTSAANYNITGLLTGTTYYYKVRAYRIVGSIKIYSNFSSVVSEKSIPAVPASVKAVSSSYNSINLSWSGVTGASGYEIYRAASSTETYALISSNAANSYNNTGLSTGTTYYYKIRAYRTVGTTRVYGNYSSIISVKPIPASPASVKAASSSYDGINVSWSGVSGASGYEVYRAASSEGTYVLISSTATASYNNTGLITNCNYYYKIRAYRIVDSINVYGNFSSATNAKPIPSAPVSVKAVSSSYNSINASWSGVVGASGYQVYRATSSTGTYVLTATTAGLSYNNTGLITNSTYYYKVRVYRIVGSIKIYSNFSSVVSTRPIPAAPASVKAVSSSYNSININWSGVTGASGYQVYRGASSTGTYSLILTTAASSCNITGLLTGTTYYYKVRAYRIVGSIKIYSNFSSVVSEKSIPAVPASVKAVSSSYNSINLSWSGVTGASGYEVYRAASSTGSYALISTSTSTNITDTDLLTGTTYYYEVRAYTAIGAAKAYSNYSAAVSGTTAMNPVVSITSISLSKTTDNLAAGDTDILSVAIAPANASNKAVIWTSSDNTIASVDNVGMVTAVSEGIVTITATTADGSKSASCTVNVNIIKGYGYTHNTDFQVDLNVRSSPGLSGSIIGHLYNFQKVEILDTIVDNSNTFWDKIIYNNDVAYVSDAYIQHYTSPPDVAVNIAVNITKQFEVGTSDQIAGNFDGQGISLGYLQWCIGQGTLQPLLNRMDRQYNSEIITIFGTNYGVLHSMTLDTLTNQLTWAKSINDSSNNIISPWYSQFASLSNNQDFINIENDAKVYTVKQAMVICDKYNLKTVRGFALAFDIVNQNGSINSNAAKIIDTALEQTPNMTEKSLLGVIANAVADSSSNNSEDIRSRKMAIVNGQGIVHGSMCYLDTNYGLSDNCWR